MWFGVCVPCSHSSRLARTVAAVRQLSVAGVSTDALTALWVWKLAGVRLCVCVCAGLWCVLVFFRENGFCISALVSSSSPPSPSLPHSCPSIPLSLSSYYSHSALEGRQRTLNALCCLLHCLCCFSAPVPHSLPIFVFINHNGCLLRVSWWLFWSSFVPQRSFCL